MRDGGAVLGVEVGVDFVEEVEGRGVALLDCEDEGEGAETLGGGLVLIISTQKKTGEGERGTYSSAHH